ncbi:MAG TPA: GNAT family N-acetyltransferase, partial [Micromonosporaceae bacterium]
MQFITDPGEFLDVAGDYLAAEPVINTVVTTTAHKQLAQRAAGIAPPAYNWWLVVRDDAGAIVGAAMRTAPFAPYPPYLLPMPDQAAVTLARMLHESSDEVLAVSGALPAADLCAAELARLGGGQVEVSLHTRLH